MNVQTCKFIDSSDLFENDKFGVFRKIVDDNDWIVQGNFNRSLLDKDSVILLLNSVPFDDEMDNVTREEDFYQYIEHVVGILTKLPNNVLIDMEN